MMICIKLIKGKELISLNQFKANNWKDLSSQISDAVKVMAERGFSWDEINVQITKENKL